MNKNSVLYILLKYLRSSFREGRYIRDIYKSSYDKKVLISYTVLPFLVKKKSRPNHLEAGQIAEVFHEMGYSVDILHYTNDRRIDYSIYDVLFGFGFPLENSFNYSTDIKRICYATGAQVCFQNSAELKRIKNVNKKYKSNIGAKRLVPWMWSRSIQLSDAIVIIGNDWVKSTYSQFSDAPMLKINTTAMHNVEFDDKKRNYKKSKNNYLWFGGSGLVHKGLDLCLEFFSENPEFNLHICGPYEKDFFCVFEKKLNCNNIFYHGYVDVSSDKFLNVVYQCCYMILPSCSEAQATSVLTAMNVGLVPIITKNVGMDIKGVGFLIDGLTVRDLEVAINLTRSIDSSHYEALSNRARSRARSEHSIEYFKKNLKKIFHELEL